MNHHFADTNIIPLPSIDWGGGDIRDVTLLELTTPDGITGIGFAYTGVSQVRDALKRKLGSNRDYDIERKLGSNRDYEIANWGRTEIKQIFGSTPIFSLTQSQ